MAIDEATRHHLHAQAARSMDERAADGLMEMLPPVGWADVATKHDLAQLEQRIDLRFALVHHDLVSLEERIDLRFEGMDLRFEALDLRFEALDPRFEAIDDRFDRVRAELVGELHRTLNAQTKTLFFGIITVMTGIVAIAVALAH